MARSKPGWSKARPRGLLNPEAKVLWTPPGVNGGDAVVYSILVQPDGKVLVGGSNLESFNGVANANLGRLNSDGSVDPTFDTARLYRDARRMLEEIEGGERVARYPRIYVG